MDAIPGEAQREVRLPPNPRVLFVSEPHAGPYEYIFARFPDAFARVGCALARLDPLATSPEGYRKALESFKPDIFFGLLRHPLAIRKAADLLDLYHPMPALNWFQEDPNFVTAVTVKASRSFDYWFTQDPRTVPFWPTKAFFSPHAFDETVYFERHVERMYDVSYIGQLGNEECTQMLWPYMRELARYGRKALMALERPMGPPLLPRLMEKALRTPHLRAFWQSLPVWQCVWKNPRDEAEKAILVSQSKIHFALNRVRGPWEDAVKALFPGYPLDRHGLFCQTKGRLLHATATGTLALNDYVPELDEMFEVGKEIITYECGNYEDVRDKLRYYLGHDEERQRIARAGSERARRQHTFVARIREIFDAVQAQG